MAKSERRYQVGITRAALREIERIDQKRDRQRILGAIGELAQEPRPPGVVKLVGTTDAYRIPRGSEAEPSSSDPAPSAAGSTARHRPMDTAAELDAQQQDALSMTETSPSATDGRHLLHRGGRAGFHASGTGPRALFSQGRGPHGTAGDCSRTLCHSGTAA